jgi:hypothetical protein
MASHSGSDELFEQVAERRRLEQRVDRLLAAARNARYVDSLFGEGSEDARTDAKDVHAQAPSPKPDAWERVQQGFELSDNEGAVWTHELVDAVTDHPAVQDIAAAVQRGEDPWRGPSAPPEMRFYWAVIDGDRDVAMALAHKHAADRKFQRQIDELEDEHREELLPPPDAATQAEIIRLKNEWWAGAHSDDKRAQRTGWKAYHRAEKLKRRHYDEAQRRGLQEQSAIAHEGTSVPTQSNAAPATTHIPNPGKRKPEGFPKGTPVVTDRGIVFIEDVRQGDQVVDHNGRWAKVTKSHRHKGPTARISGDGHPPIEASDSHPVLVRQKDGSPAWVAPRLLNPKIHEWATPTHFDPLPIPAGAPDSPEEWHLVGNYLRSGTINGDRITIKATDRREAQAIRQHLTGWTGREDKGGGVTFEGRDQAQAKWLAEHFGDKPHTKTVPPWALGMDEDHRRALLKGYYGPDWRPLPTASPFLVTGARLVAETLGERTDITPVWSPFRPKYQAARLDGGHGGGGNHSWLRNQRGEKTGQVRDLFELEVGEGGGGSFVAGIGGKVVSACGEKQPPKPDARSRTAATPPASAARNGGGGGGSSGRSTQSPTSKPRRIPSVASIADALGSSVPVVGGRKPRTPQRNTAGVVTLTPAQEQRVQRGIRSLDGIQREEAVANAAAVSQSVASPRAQRAARAAENSLFLRGGVETNTSTLALDKDGKVVGVPSLEELRQVDRINGHEEGTAASVLAKQHGLVKESVPDVLAAERPAREQRVIRDWGDATTTNHLGKVTAEQFLPGNLAHPNGHPDPDPETALINDPLVRMNQAGFVTHGSQPGIANSVGATGAIFHQNAAVEGFATPDTAQRIREAAEAEGLTVIQHSGAARRRDYSDIDRESDFGTHLSHSDVDLALGNGVNRSLRRELHSAEQIAVVDPDVGRNDRLERFAQRMDEQRRSDPINDAWMVDDLNGLPPGTTENDIRRANGEVVPNLRDELHTPAEREERAARMAAADQAHTQDRVATPESQPVADVRTLPLDTPAHDAVGRDGFDGFAANAERRGIAATPEHAPQPVVTRVDGRPVTAEIVDMAGAVGNGHAGLPTAERARLEAGSQEPDLLQQITEASALREMQTVPVGREQSGRLRDAAPMWEQQASTGAPRQSSPNPLTDTSWLREGTERNAEPVSTTAPSGWNDAYATQARVAAEARERGLPVDRETFERNLDEAWARLGGQGPRTAPPEHERGLRQAGERDLPEPVYGRGRAAEQDDVAPEHRRGLARPEDAELPPPPSVDDAQLAERPPHDPDVLERHGLRDLAQDHEPSPKPADNAGDERPTDGPSRPDADEEQDREQAKEARPEPEASREGADAKPERDAEPERETELVADHTPEPEPARETAETRDLAPDHSAAETDTTPSHEIGGNSHGMG